MPSPSAALPCTSRPRDRPSSRPNKSAPPPPNPEPQVTEEVQTIRDMPASTTNNPPDLEEAFGISDNSLQELSDQPRTTSVDEVLAIPDHMMVFRSNEVSAPSQVSKKMQSKASKARFKKREDTPAPSTKGDGRKRLDVSPFPEDKQVCKWLDFGSGCDLTTEGSDLEKESPPAIPLPEEPDDPPSNVEHESGVACLALNLLTEKSPDSGDVGAGDEMVVGDDEDNRLEPPSTKDKGSAGTNEILVGEIVNLPEMVKEPKQLSESPLVPCHIEESRVELAVGAPMLPKFDSLIHLANLDSAEILDTTVAQPLLNPNQPEEAQMTAKTPLMLLPATDTAMPTPLASFVPSLEEFPPLARGSTLKIRDAFERGVNKPRSVSAWSWKKPEGLDQRDTVPSEGVNAAGERPSTSSAGPNQPHGPEAASGNANKPKTMADLIRENPDQHVPQVFEPEKIKNIGIATLSNGIPAIYFSGAEIQKLAENIGHAIVRKFSHSIPTSHQIQKNV